MRPVAKLSKICKSFRSVKSLLFSSLDSATTKETPLDKIELKSLQLYGYHGVGPGEKKYGQPFVVDAVLFLPLRRSGLSDNLHHTVNYVSVMRDLEKIVAGPSVDLIEHLAETMCYRLLAEYPMLHRVQISIRKPEAPLPRPKETFDSVEGPFVVFGGEVPVACDGGDVTSYGHDYLALGLSGACDGRYRFREVLLFGFGWTLSCLPFSVGDAFVAADIDGLYLECNFATQQDF